MKPVSHCISSSTPVVSYKRVCCRGPFCSVSVQNLSRHMLAVHIDEPEVRKLRMDASPISIGGQILLD